jgi:hypothetical protein
VAPLNVPHPELRFDPEMWEFGRPRRALTLSITLFDPSESKIAVVTGSERQGDDMSERARIQSAVPPAAAPREKELTAMLGSARKAFDALARDAGVTRQWRRYKKDSPWVLKVSAGKRTLYYLQPDTGAVTVTVVLGARAVEAALSGGVAKILHPAIRGAKAYAEGRPVRVVAKSMRT